MRAHKTELLSECEALAAADRRAAGLPLNAPEEDEDPPPDEVPPGPDEEDEEGRAAPGPLVWPVGASDARAGEDLDEEVWIALENRAGYKLHGAVLVNAAGAEFARLGDRGVLRRRGEAVVVGLLGTEEPRGESGPDLKLRGRAR